MSEYNKHPWNPNEIPDPLSMFNDILNPWANMAPAQPQAFSEPVPLMVFGAGTRSNRGSIGDTSLIGTRSGDPPQVPQGPPALDALRTVLRSRRDNDPAQFVHLKDLRNKVVEAINEAHQEMETRNETVVADVAKYTQKLERFLASKFPNDDVSNLEPTEQEEALDEDERTIRNSSDGEDEEEEEEPKPTEEQPRTGGDEDEEDEEDEDGAPLYVFGTFNLQAHPARLLSYTGSDPAISFSTFYRRFEDLCAMQVPPMDDEAKKKCLVAHLDSRARECIEELQGAGAATLAEIVAHLKANFEGEPYKQLALQSLSSCQQAQGESVAAFSMRLSSLVKAATAGQDAAVQKDRALQELMSRLRSPMKYQVRISDPATYEDAVRKAAQIEAMANEAAETAVLSPVVMQSMTQQRPIPTAQHAQFPPSQERGPPPMRGNQNTITCFSCGKPGHMRRECRSGGKSKSNKNGRNDRRKKGNGGQGQFWQGQGQYQGPQQFHNWQAPQQYWQGQGQYQGPPQYPQYQGAPQNWQGAQQIPQLQQSQGWQGWKQQQAQGRNWQGAPQPPMQYVVPYGYQQEEPQYYPMPTQSVPQITEPAPIRAIMPAITAESQMDLTLQQAVSQAEQAGRAMRVADERLAALTQRKLAISNGSQKKTQSGGATPIMLLTGVMCLFALMGAAGATDAWICPDDAHEEIMRFPSQHECARSLPATSATAKEMTIDLYKPNMRMYTTPAHACKKQKTTVKYYMPFIGGRSTGQPVTETIPTTEEECTRMIKHESCEYGDLSAHGGYQSTTNRPEVKWPSWPWGVGEGETVAYNCLLIRTEVSMRHGGKPTTTQGSMESCTYDDGTCILRDGTVILFKPDEEEKCDYVRVGKMKGIRTGTSWLSDSEELAMTWSNESSTVLDCSTRILITDQGYGIQELHEQRRPKRNTGIVTSEQLAAIVQAVEMGVQKKLGGILRTSLSSVCERVNSMGVTIHAALAADPTYVTRALLKREDIAARYRGNGVVLVRRCTPVPMDAHRFLPFNGTCYDQPKVEIKGSDGSTIVAFWSHTSGIISKTAAAKPCEEGEIVVYPWKGTWLQLDPNTARITNLGQGGVPTVEGASWEKLPSLPRFTIYHQMIMTNLTELVPDARFEESFRTIDTSSLEKVGTRPDNEAPRESPSWMPTWLTLSWREAFTTVGAAVAILYLVRDLFMAYLRYKLSHMPSWSFGPTTGGPPEPVKQTIDIRPVLVRDFQTEPHPPCPKRPKAKIPEFGESMVPIQIMNVETALGKRSRGWFVPQITVVANGVPMLALVDSGAGVTAASKELTKVLGIPTLQKSMIKSAVGISGGAIPFAGVANVSIQIGGITLDTAVHFTEETCIPTDPDRHNLVLGNDLLRQLPRWSIDYQGGNLQVGREDIPMMNSLVISHEKELKVKVANTVTCTAEAETFIECLVPSLGENEIATITGGAEMTEKGWFVTPSLTIGGKVNVLVSNPDRIPRTLYKGQTIGTACRVEETKGGTFDVIPLVTMQKYCS